MNGRRGHLAVVMDYIMCNHAHCPLWAVVTLYSNHPHQHCTSALSSSLGTSPSLMFLTFMMIVISSSLYTGEGVIWQSYNLPSSVKKSGSTKKGVASTQNIFNKPWVLDRGQRTARADCKSDLHDFVSGEASTPRILRYLAAIFNVYDFFSLWTKFVNFEYILCISSSLFSSGEASTPAVLLSLSIGIGTKAPYCCSAHHHLCIISNNAIIAISSKTFIGAVYPCPSFVGLALYELELRKSPHCLPKQL